MIMKLVSSMFSSKNQNEDPNLLNQQQLNATLGKDIGFYRHMTKSKALKGRSKVKIIGTGE